MDNHPWLNKCTSNWQSTLIPSMASSSSQVQPQESRNHLDMNTGPYLYPHMVQDPRSTARGRVREPTLPNPLNLGSYKSDDAGVGNSYPAVLTGPPSLLQCNVQQLSNPKPFDTSSKLPINSVVGSGFPLTRIGPVSETRGNQNKRNGADFSQVVSSNAAVSINCNSTIGLNNNLPAACFNLQRSDMGMAKAARDISFSRGEWDSSANFANSGKLHRTNFEALQKISIERNSFISNQSSTSLSGCPRVFCLSLSGDLLLSNTGLLGVVCSCHCLHMSISKFCEHSGLYDVNPGDAVRMDSGETIARWRKLYFQKFGIRVSEDQNGWDWPECFSATAGLVKPNSTVPSISKDFDMYRLIGSSGGSVRSGQPPDNLLSSENSLPDQNHLNDILRNKQLRNAQDSCNFLFKGFAGASQSNLHVEDNHLPRCSTMSKFMGRGRPDNDCQSISAYIDSISSSGNSFMSKPTLQNLRILGANSDVREASNLKEAVIVDRDAVSSNIELRLGQPYQQSWNLGNTLLPVRPKPLDKLGDQQKSVSHDHLIHKHNFKVAGKCSQYPPCVSGTSDITTMREQNQSNFISYSSGANNELDTAKFEQCKGDPTKSSVISMLLSHINALSEGNGHSRANHNIANGNEHSMPRTLPCESHIAQCNCAPIKYPWNSCDGLGRNSSIKASGLLNRHMDEGKGVRCVAGSSYSAAESYYEIPKRMDSSQILNGVVGGSSNPRNTAVHDRDLYSCQFSGMPMDASSDAINFLNNSGKVLSSGNSGQNNNVFLRSLSSAVSAGIISPPQAASILYSSATSTSTSNLTSALQNKEGMGISPHVEDESLRLLAARHMLELSKQGSAISSPGMSQPGRFGSSSHVKFPGVDPMCAEQRHQLNLASKKDVSEIVLIPPQSSATHRKGGDIDKVDPMTGLSNWCNHSTSMHGNSLNSKDVDMQGQYSHNPFSNEHPSLRLGRSESIIQSNEHGQSSQKISNTCFPGNCSCAVQTKCLGGDCNSKFGISSDAFKEQIGSVGCCEGSMSMSLTSNIDKDYTVHKEKTLFLEKDGKMDVHMPAKINCHAFQWKDVPNKVVGICNKTHLDKPTTALDGRENDVHQLDDSAGKSLKRTEQEVNTMKGKEMSNISSGCSTPAVTQASIDVNNTDSCTVDEGDAKYVNNVEVDEGSVVDKCWSSDDVICSERSAEFLGSTYKSNFLNERSSKALGHRSPCNLIDEIKILDSLRWKNGRNQIQTTPTSYDKTNHLQKVENGPKSGKRKRDIKWKMLASSFPASGISSVNNGSSTHIGGARLQWHSPPHNDKEVLLSDQETSDSFDTAFAGPNLHQRSSLSSTKTSSFKRDLHRVYNHNTEEEDGYETDHADFLDVPHVSRVKRFRQDWPPHASKELCLQKSNYKDSVAAAKFISVDSTKAVSSWKTNNFTRKEKPVVCGKYGIISNGITALDISKPAKIVSLSSILKTARRCTLSENCGPRSTSIKKLKNKRSKGNNKLFDEFSGLKERDSEKHNATECNELDHDVMENTCLNGDKERAGELSRLEKERDDGRVKLRSISDSYRSTGSKSKPKEIRKRSLCELTVKGNNSTCGPQKKCRSLGKFESTAGNSVCQNGEQCDVSAKESITNESFISKPDAFCCVCGSSNKHEINCLLECSQCLIRVHQACYGVAKVPKGHWYCRPCRTSSKHIVCVLCGYEGGAMTRALRSHDIVKSLLKAWNIETEYKAKNKLHSSEAFNDELSISSSSKSELKGDLFPVIRPVNIEASSTAATAAGKLDMQKQPEMLQKVPGSSSKLKNSITVGIFDPTVKQWVHMVCGLWTPGTRCPNVDTMSAFDVSGASCPRASVVCSICNRSGGSFIQCRVVNCFVQFHPWCAHEKGLLQSEVEGIDNECVGFYGRCVLHAACPPSKIFKEPLDSETHSPEEKGLTCARTEGYKGRKRDGFRHINFCQSNGNAGCLVPQEQLDAWVHINGKKPYTERLPKQSVSEIEHDCRKEYARYKQAKGWKQLVVYKSGIHALGLYTSQFIYRGAMVVEYVGEIVGLRVADKREIEYQSGRKLQYKSACYFFRIDKEHIIDATCKGGIARFVNHSCLPNCVAKVISVRNVKKVVFFAERDIFPGEEITYDYHFNHEDEGKKIPCFCNSKNCRRYLN